MATIQFDVTSYRLLIGAELDDLTVELGLAIDSALVCDGKDAGVRICGVPRGPVPVNRIDGRRGIIFIPHRQFSWYVDLLRHERPVTCALDLTSPQFHQLRTGQSPIGEHEPAAEAPAPPDLNEWLNAHPDFKQALVWAEKAAAAVDHSAPLHPAPPEA